MKENMYYSEHYSISYEIWHDDVIKYYNILNDALNDCQAATIDNVEFIYSERTPTDSEVAADKAEADAIAAEEAEEAADKAAKAARKAERDYRKAVEAAEAAGEAIPERPEAAEAAASTKKEAEAAEGYVKTKYTTALGTVVKVTYSNGVVFYLNFNSYQVKTEGQTIEAFDFVRIG